MCQSCGMPMSKDPQSGGTNADGSKNLKFCSYCFQNGEFSFNGSVQEFQEFCRQKMIESCHNRFISWLFTHSAINIYRNSNSKIIFVQHNNHQLKNGTSDWEIDKRLEKNENDILIQKKNHGDAFKIPI